MIPILYGQNETAFTSNGIGRLVDIISCKATEERNGIYECEFEYPVTGSRFSEITEGRIIYTTHDESQTPEPFDIYSHTAPIDGVVTFRARHISYRLAGCIAKTRSYSSLANLFAGVPARCVEDCPFDFSTDKPNRSSGPRYDITAPISLRSMLGGTEGSVLDVYGTGEYEFTKFHVDLWAHRGQTLDTVIRYGKNLTELEYERDDSGAYNACVPFWKSADGSTVVTLPEWSVSSGHGVAYIEQWTDHNGNIMTDHDDHDFDFKYFREKAVTLDLSGDFTDAPTVEQLRTAALAKMTNNETWLPTENLKIDFVALWQTAEYANYAPLERVKLCDTVTIQYDALGINVQKKVIRVVYNSLLERYDEIELGDSLETFADVIENTALPDYITKTEATKAVSEAVADATKMITGGAGGYIYYNIVDGETREIYAMDSPIVAQARNIIRINKNGIGFSTNGINGPYGSAWTIDGKFNADYIKAGKLSSYDGSTFFDLASGWLVSTPSSVTDYRQDSVQIHNGSFYIMRDGEYFARICPATRNSRKFVAFVGRGADYNNNYNGGIMFGKIVTSTSFKLGILLYGKYDEDGDTFSEPIILAENTRILGKVYLGKTYNQYLQAEGTQNVEIGYDVTIAHGLYITSTCSAIEYYTRSDENLKNFYGWDERYDRLIDLIEPALFTWKTDNVAHKHIGVSAQKLRTALSQLGITDSGAVASDEGGLNVNYTDLSMLLFRRVKEQQARIDDLEERIAALERRLNANS